MARKLEPGDLVTYTQRPAWGEGVVEWVGPTGKLVASFETPEGPYVDDFGEGEVARTGRVVPVPAPAKVKRPPV